MCHSIGQKSRTMGSCLCSNLTWTSSGAGQPSSDIFVHERSNLRGYFLLHLGDVYYHCHWLLLRLYIWKKKSKITEPWVLVMAAGVDFYLLRHHSARQRLWNTLYRETSLSPGMCGPTYTFILRGKRATATFFWNRMFFLHPEPPSPPHLHLKYGPMAAVQERCNFDHL